MPQNDDTRKELAALRKEVKRLRAALDRQSPGLDALLARRGFTIYKKEPADDLLVPSRAYRARYYRMLHKYSFRLLLRDVIRRHGVFTPEDVTRYSTAGVTKKYLEDLLSVRLLKKKAGSYALATGRVKSFGETLEWYVAEAFRREFGSEAVWGAKFKRPRVGGDYDVISKLDGALFYVEAKSSPPKQIYDSEIAAFLDRVGDLLPAIAVFLMDTELRMKDKIVPMFEAELARRSPYPAGVVRMERELFTIENRIFIINAKEDLIGNLRKVWYWYYRHQ